VTDGAVLPILHLNGYKIANPAVLARIPKEELDQLLRGYGYTPYHVEGSDPDHMHQQMAAALDTVVKEIKSIQKQARTKGFKERPLWPMIVLRSPKGWTCPESIDGKKCEDYWRSHQVPMGDMDKSGHVKILEQWLKSYRPDELFDKSGHFKPELAELAPKASAAWAPIRTETGGCCSRTCVCPRSRILPSRSPHRARSTSRPRAYRASTWRRS
jgi:xylulose-5-phosphate/fructose-6-phosphate phosphoketolase